MGRRRNGETAVVVAVAEKETDLLAEFIASH
jgi:hypothetical protein